MPNKNKRRGDYVERKCVKLIEEEGWKAQRVPLSGGAGGEFSGDIYANLPANKVNPVWTGFASRIECKSRKNNTGYGQVIEWLGKNDYLLLERSGGTPLVVMTWEKFCGIQHLLERITASDEAEASGPGHRDNGGGLKERSTDADPRFRRHLFSDSTFERDGPGQFSEPS